MKRKNSLSLLVVVAVLLLGVGYAAISATTLSVGGTVAAQPNDANFDVHFDISQLSTTRSFERTDSIYQIWTVDANNALSGYHNFYNSAALYKPATSKGYVNVSIDEENSLLLHIEVHNLNTKDSWAWLTIPIVNGSNSDLNASLSLGDYSISHPEFITITRHSTQYISLNSALLAPGETTSLFIPMWFLKSNVDEDLTITVDIPVVATPVNTTLEND